MQNKRMVAVLPALLFVIFSANVLAKVITGKIGSHEPWRITAAVLGFTLFAAITWMFIRKTKQTS